MAEDTCEGVWTGAFGGGELVQSSEGDDGFAGRNQGEGIREGWCLTKGLTLVLVVTGWVYFLWWIGLKLGLGM